MNIINIVGLLAALGTTSSFVPQAIKTIQTKNTSGISLYMYSLFAAGTLFWLTYGLMCNSVPIVIANGVTLIFACIILAYKIRYK